MRDYFSWQRSVDEIALKSVKITEDEKAAVVTAKKKKKAETGSDDEDDDQPLEDQSDQVKKRLEELLEIAEKQIRKYGMVRPKTEKEKKDGASSKKTKSSDRPAGMAREPTSHEMQYRTVLVQSFFKEIQSKKCQSCGAFSPNLRRDGHTKIFRLPLTKVQQQTMDLLNLKFDDVLALTEGGFEKGSENWERMMRERNSTKSIKRS